MKKTSVGELNVKGFTVGKKELDERIKKFKKEFYEQNHCSDAVNFIANKLDAIGFINNAALVKMSKSTLVNKYLVKDGIASLQDNYEKYHKRPNPNYSYDNNGPRDLVEDDV